jgi:hypothetical protein
LRENNNQNNARFGYTFATTILKEDYHSNASPRDKKRMLRFFKKLPILLSFIGLKQRFLQIVTLVINNFRQIFNQKAA